MLWDYLKTLIMLRLTLQAPCMCAGCKRGRRRSRRSLAARARNREGFHGDLLIKRAKHGWDNLPPLQGAA
jgi:hypothetical protein